MARKRALFATSIFVLGLSEAPLAHSFSTQREAVGNTPGHGAASDYLSTLSSAPTVAFDEEAMQQSNIFSDDAHGDIPDEHYSKDYPNAGWRGYANPQWGGYLDALPSNRLEEGKKSDYGNDIRWGAEVYLNSVEE